MPSIDRSNHQTERFVLFFQDILLHFAELIPLTVDLLITLFEIQSDLF